MKKIILLIAVFILLLVSCAPKSETPEPKQASPEAMKIPQNIVEKSDQFVRSKVGSQFFDNYIQINYDMSSYNPPDDWCMQNPDSCSAFTRKPNYLMVYSLKIPKKPYVDVLLEFAVDIDGNVIPERDVMGIPDCVNNPIECNFQIDKSKAISIAKNAKLEEGFAPWKTSFNWHGQYKKYIWTVSNTLSETGSGQMYRANGKVVLIDANTGEVLEVGTWGSMA